MCRKNEIPEIKENHKKLIDLYLEFKTILKPLTEETNQNIKKKPITKFELSDKINKLIQYSESFDIDGLDNLINELKAFSLPLDFSQKFDNICKSIENVDFKELRNLLSEWSNR